MRRLAVFLRALRALWPFVSRAEYVRLRAQAAATQRNLRTATLEEAAMHRLAQEREVECEVMACVREMALSGISQGTANIVRDYERSLRTAYELPPEPRRQDRRMASLARLGPRS